MARPPSFQYFLDQNLCVKTSQYHKFVCEDDLIKPMDGYACMLASPYYFDKNGRDALSAQPRIHSEMIHWGRG